MQITLVVTLVLHVLSGVFWAGTTFASARTGGNQADLFFRPQMGAAAIAVVTGGILWFLLHRGVALLAAGVQDNGRAGPAQTLGSRRIRGFALAPARGERPAHRRSPVGDHSHVHGGGPLRLTRGAHGSPEG